MQQGELVRPPGRKRFREQQSHPNRPSLPSLAPALAISAKMANRISSGGVVASAAAGFLLLASHHVDGHCHQQFPVSRQYADFYDPE